VVRLALTFKLGFYEKGGQFEGKFKGFSLTLRQIRTWRVFALFGVGLAALGFTRRVKADFKLPVAISEEYRCPGPDLSNLGPQAPSVNNAEVKSSANSTPNGLGKPIGHPSPATPELKFAVRESSVECSPLDASKHLSKRIVANN
jgi:hypothetical protein